MRSGKTHGFQAFLRPAGQARQPEIRKTGSVSWLGSAVRREDTRPDWTTPRTYLPDGFPERLPEVL